MSYQQFVGVLESLGCPKAKTIRQLSGEWLFEANMAPFMTWFCTQISRSNLLSPEERSQFSVLESSGSPVLEVTQFEDVSLLSDEQDTTSKESLRKEIELLKADIQRQQERKEAQIRQRNLPGEHVYSQTRMLKKCEKTQKNCEQEYRKALKQTFANDNFKNESVSRLVKSVDEMNELYEKHEEADSYHDYQQEKAHFLSDVHLKHLLKVEEKYMKIVTLYCKTQFCEGIADIAGHSTSSLFNFVEIGNPKSPFLCPDNAEEFLRYSKELKRLQALYPWSEHSRFESHGIRAVSRGVHKEATALMERLQDFPSGVLSLSLRHELQQLQRKIFRVKRAVMYYTDEVIPDMIAENTRSQIFPIITGNYQLKLERQAYFMSIQDQLISYLVAERARYEFLTMAYELEFRQHRYVHRLLRCINSHIASEETSRQERMVLMDDPRLTVEKYQRSTISFKDAPSQRLHAVLVESSDSAEVFYQKFSSILEAADKLYHNLESAQLQVTKTCDSSDEQLSKMQASASKIVAQLYIHSCTSRGTPQLTPQPILKAQRELTKLVKHLQKLFLDKRTEVQKWKTVQKIDAYSRAEREIFRYFLVAPDKLRIMLQKLSQRIKAHNIR